MAESEARSKTERKEKLTLFSDHNGSLQRRQPGAKISERQSANQKQDLRKTVRANQKQDQRKTVRANQKQDLRKTVSGTCEMAECIWSGNAPRPAISPSGMYNVAAKRDTNLGQSSLEEHTYMFVPPPPPKMRLLVVLGRVSHTNCVCRGLGPYMGVRKIIKGACIPWQSQPYVKSRELPCVSKKKEGTCSPWQSQPHQLRL